MDKILDHALKYRKIGWNVLPLINNEKGNVPGGWIEWQERKPTDEEFDKLFKTPGITGLALMTGKTSNILMVDYDSYAKDAPKIVLESTLVSRTTSGGFHYYYQYEDLPENRIRGIEIKNATLDVLPPSNAKNKMNEIGTYSWIKRDYKSVPKLPNFIKEMFQTKESKMKATLSELLSAGEGTRHASFLSASNQMFFRFPEDQWPLAEEFLRSSLDKFDPPYHVGHSQKDIDNVIRDAKMYAKTHKKDSSSKPTQIKEIPDPVSLKQAYLERIEEVKREEKAPKTGYVELDTAIAGWTPGFVYILAGDTGVGKTALACNFALRVSEQGKKVLYYAIETQNEIIDYLASARTKKPYRVLTEDDRSYDDPNIMIYRNEVLNLPDLEYTLKKQSKHFDLAIVDNIGFFEESSGNLSQSQAELMRALSKTAMESQMAIIIIAHFNKSAPNGKDIVTANRISGSKAFQNYAKGILLFKRDKASPDPDEVVFAPNGLLIVAKSKRGSNAAFRLVFDNSGAYMRSDGDFPVDSLERSGF